MARKGVQYAVVDAFTNSPFCGNPAAVCLLGGEGAEKDERWMKSVAKEFNLSQTAFLIPESDVSGGRRFHLRWFTPMAEVDLCGHATLASAHFLFSSGLVGGNKVEFLTRSGLLTADKVEGFKNIDGQAEGSFAVELDFPVIPVVECSPFDIPSIPTTLNGATISSIKKTSINDLIIEVMSGNVVKDIQPQFDELEKCPGRGVIITGAAPQGSGFDFFSRFFFPKLGITEVDAFTDVPFKGNPAVACVLEEERDEHWMQEAAKEFGICVTAFVRPASRECTPPENGDAIFHLRWFTPVTELGICGHATLATSHHLFSSGIVAGTRIKFLTNSGPIRADKIEGSLSAAGVPSAGGTKDEFCIELDLPRFTVHDCDPAPYLSLFSETLNGVQIKVTMNSLLALKVEIESGDAVRELQPRMDELSKWQGRAVVVTGIASPDSGFDFISRFFGPKIGIDEVNVEKKNPMICLSQTHSYTVCFKFIFYF
ncbi:putative isomerase [Nymphaea thermarum]|nr:putative isomerase [Nymphaea thermarum]